MYRGICPPAWPPNLRLRPALTFHCVFPALFAFSSSLAQPLHSDTILEAQETGTTSSARPHHQDGHRRSSPALSRRNGALRVTDAGEGKRIRETGHFTGRFQG